MECGLCRGDHSALKPINHYDKCPFCEKEQIWTLEPHCPGGVSHGETHPCENCGAELFFIVYYDRLVIISPTSSKQHKVFEKVC